MCNCKGVQSLVLRYQVLAQDGITSWLCMSYQRGRSPGRKISHTNACMCSKTSMSAHMCTCMCSKTCMYACMCSQTPMSAPMCSQTCICAHICAFMCSQTRMCTCICTPSVNWPSACGLFYCNRLAP